MLICFAIYHILPLEEVGNNRVDDTFSKGDETKYEFDVDEESNRLNSITYVNVGMSSYKSPYENYYFIPVSYIKDGIQLLTGISNVYSQMSETILQKAPDPTELSMYFCHLNCSKVSTNLDTIASNGKWDFFPVKVIYKKYSQGIQPNQKKWEDYFGNQLDDASIKSPVIITESWTFDWDGIETAVVNASNAITTDSEEILYASESQQIPESFPANHDSSIYAMSAIFRTGNEPVMVFKKYESILDEPLAPTNESVSYLSPENTEEPFQHLFSVIQYNENNDLELYPVFCNMGGELLIRDYKFMPEYLPCDIDGDDHIELIVYIRSQSSLLSSCKVYRLINSVPTHIYSVKPN